eukprot:6185550-Pleurochrysis_carterae.AAC.2
MFPIRQSSIGRPPPAPARRSRRHGLRRSSRSGGYSSDGGCQRSAEKLNGNPQLDVAQARAHSFTKT